MMDYQKYKYDSVSRVHVPRWTAKKSKQGINLIILFFIFLTAIFLIFTAINLVASVTFQSSLLFGLAITMFLFAVTRLIFDLYKYKDFIEITTEGITYRSTPSFGNGWLPKNGEVDFKDIELVDIVYVHSFINPEVKQTALLLKTMYRNPTIIGQNLSEEEIFQIGLALKGSVKVSRALSNLLGEEEVSDQLKNIVDFGKSVWKTFRNRGQE